MSAPPPPPRPRPRGKPSRQLRGRIAALGIVAALMVALPLSLLLRRQQSELDALAARRAVLDPIARSLDTQRSLLEHRDMAGRVLRSQPALEPDRKVLQAEVDDRMTALAVALATGPWDRAVQESDQLRDDWSRLMRQLLAHQLGADDSDRGHGLLVEQTLTIVDLLDLAQAGERPEQARGPAPQRARPTAASLQAERQAIDRQAGAVQTERKLVLLGLLLLAFIGWRQARPLQAASRRERADFRPSEQALETNRLLDRLRHGRRDAPPSELPPDSRIGDLRQP